MHKEAAAAASSEADRRLTIASMPADRRDMELIFLDIPSFRRSWHEP
jgi:hypothetical protein